MKKKLLGLFLISCCFGIAYSLATKENKHTSNLSEMYDIDALADPESSSSCTASLSCSLASDNDYVSCSGKKCSRNATERYVECDGVKTSC